MFSTILRTLARRAAKAYLKLALQRKVKIDGKLESKEIRVILEEMGEPLLDLLDQYTDRKDATSKDLISDIRYRFGQLRDRL